MDSQWQKIVTNLRVPIHILNMPGAHSVACVVLVKAGTRDECWPEEAGLAHATEHLVFHGTRDFPDSADIDACVEDVGGRISAHTSGEKTVFFSHVPAEDIERSIKVLSQLTLHPLFREKDIKIEMQNIIQEIRMYHDDDQDYLLNLAKANMYGEHPLGRNTIGLEEAVKHFKRRHFLNFYSHYYNVNNFDFIAAGRIGSKTQVVDLFNKYFAEAPDGPFNDREVLINVNNPTSFCRRNRDITQLHIAMMAPTAMGASRESQLLDIFRVMIDGGASFPLFQEIRNKRGLCYEVSAEHVFFSDLSLFAIYIACDPTRQREAVEAIFRLMHANKKNVKLLEKAKKRIRGSLALMYESPDRILESHAVADVALMGRPRDYEEILKILDGFSIEEVFAAAEKYLLGDPTTAFMFTYLGPNNFVPSLSPALTI